MKNATYICEWQPSKRMRNTEGKRTGGNWGRCEVLLRRFHLVGRKCNVLFYRRRRIFFSFYKFTSDILSFCHEVLEYKLSHWKWSCEYRQEALYAQTQRVLNLRKMFENQGRKKTQNNRGNSKICCTYEIKRKCIKLHFLKCHAFKIWHFRYLLEKKVYFQHYINRVLRSISADV
jgi:hypothetical protein